MLKNKQRLKDALSRESSGATKSTGISSVLSSLFIDIAIACGVDTMKWQHLMDVFIDAEAMRNGGASDNRRDRASIRGNLRKEFLKSRMTWKVFYKAMRFLQLRRFKIIILAEHDDGTVTEHSKVIQCRDTSNDDSDSGNSNGMMALASMAGDHFREEKKKEEVADATNGK